MLMVAAAASVVAAGGEMAVPKRAVEMGMDMDMEIHFPMMARATLTNLMVCRVPFALRLHAYGSTTRA